MPKVPTLSRNRVTQQPLSMGRIQTQQTNDPRSARQSQRVAEDLNNYRNKIEDAEQKKADQLAIMDADQKLSALETATLYDPKSGAMNARGKDSFSLPETVFPDFDSKAEEIGKGLANDFQRMSFQKMLGKRRGHVDRQVQRHVSKETKTYDDQVTKDYVSNEMNAAIENAHDPERIKLSMDRMKGAILSHADRNGLSQESTDRLLEDTQSKTHKSVFSKILNSGGVTSAQQYYSKYRDEVSGEDRVDLDKALKEGLIDRDSQIASDKIFNKYPDDVGKAIKEVAKIKDTEKRDEATRRLKNRYTDTRAAELHESRQSFNSAYETLESNGGVLEAIPRALWAEMEPDKKEKLKKIANDIKYGSQTDWDEFYNLKMMAGNSATRDKFKKLNLTEYFDKLADSEKKTLINLQTESKNGKNKLLDGIQTHGQIVSGILQENGIDKKDKNVPLFRKKLDELIVQQQQTTGKEVTNAEVQDLADDLMFKVVTSPGWNLPGIVDWFGITQDTEKSLFEIEPGDEMIVKIDNIPADDKLELKRALEARGIEATDDKIVEYYTNFIKAKYAK